MGDLHDISQTGDLRDTNCPDLFVDIQVEPRTRAELEMARGEEPCRGSSAESSDEERPLEPRRGSSTELSDEERPLEPRRRRGRRVVQEEDSESVVEYLPPQYQEAWAWQTRGERSHHSEQVIRDHPEWATGDFALVSSDGWRFRIDSAVLCKTSPVLKDMIERDTDGTREIRFTDSNIERRVALKGFLTLISGKLVGCTLHRYSFADVENICDTAALLRKYGAEWGLKVLRAQLHSERLAFQMAPFFVLMIAVAMDDVDLSIRAFRTPRHHWLSWHPVDPFITTQLLSLSPTSQLSDAAWPREVLHRFPLDYLWACSRAWSVKWASQYALATLRDRGCSGDSEPQCEVDIADEYERAIREVRPREASDMGRPKAEEKPAVPRSHIELCRQPRCYHSTM